MTSTAEDQLSPVFLPTKEVCRKLGRSRTSLLKLMDDDPTFPRPRKGGETRQSPLYWLEHEVDAWMRDWLSRAQKI